MNFANTINSKIDPDNISPEKKMNNLNKGHIMSYSNGNLNTVSPGIFRTTEYSYRKPNN